MLFMLFILFHIFLSVVFGRFAYFNEIKDYKKNLIKKSNIFPTEALHRSAELEYIKYQNEQYVNVKSKEMLHRMIPGMTLDNWIKPPVLTITDPDEQIIYSPVAIKDNIKDDDNQEPEAATTENGLLNDKKLKKKNLELNMELGQRPNMNETSEGPNTTEVYEEPFIRIYVKPLCEGSICQNFSSIWSK
ncbi:DNA polymerase III PolC-type [Dirofilaria immitis]